MQEHGAPAEVRNIHSPVLVLPRFSAALFLTGAPLPTRSPRYASAVLLERPAQDSKRETLDERSKAGTIYVPETEHRQDPICNIPTGNPKHSPNHKGWQIHSSCTFTLGKQIKKKKGNPDSLPTARQVLPSVRPQISHSLPFLIP